MPNRGKSFISRFGQPRLEIAREGGPPSRKLPEGFLAFLRATASRNVAGADGSSNSRSGNCFDFRIFFEFSSYDPVFHQLPGITLAFRLVSLIMLWRLFPHRVFW